MTSGVKPVMHRLDLANPNDSALMPSHWELEVIVTRGKDGLDRRRNE